MFNWSSVLINVLLIWLLPETMAKNCFMCHSISSCCWAAPSGPLYAERVMRREGEVQSHNLRWWRTKWQGEPCCLQNLTLNKGEERETASLSLHFKSSGAWMPYGRRIKSFINTLNWIGIHKCNNKQHILSWNMFVTLFGRGIFQV